YESQYRYNENGQQIYERYTSWQEDRSFPNFLNEYHYAYHPNGERAFSQTINYRVDSLRSTYTAYQDERGNVIRDSSTYRNDQGEWEYYVSQSAYTYDNQGRIQEIDRQYRDHQTPSWQQGNISTYTYDPNGCLTQLAEGTERSAPRSRRRYEYGPDCRQTARYEEERQGFDWVANSRTFISYEDGVDSSKVVRRFERFRLDSNRWVITQIRSSVLDAQGREIRSRADYADGASGEERTAYNEEDKQIYQRQGYRQFATAKWTYWYEYERLAEDDNRLFEVRRYNYDTLLQQYNSIIYYDFEYGENGRIVEQVFRDSSWNGAAYDFVERTIRFDAERYCDGLLRTEFITEGASGLSPQPTGKIEYGYAKNADCLSVESATLQIHPNPATQIIMLESELLLDPQTRIQIVNLQGQIIRELSPAGRQPRQQIDIQDLEVGLYILQLSHPEQRFAQRFYKE
ncbi:MAG: T9SS type A sorting domain-containing protein, partial [Bacteroidota bacterium]